MHVLYDKFYLGGGGSIFVGLKLNEDTNPERSLLRFVVGGSRPVGCRLEIIGDSGHPKQAWRGFSLAVREGNVFSHVLLRPRILYSV